MRDYRYLENSGMGVPRKIVKFMREHNGTEPVLIEDGERFTLRLLAAQAKKVASVAKAAVRKAATPRKTGAGLKPSAELAAVIGAEPVARTQVIKKLWDYIKANGLQDAKDKRSINADAKLLPVFGKPQVTMFELAGVVGKHLS